MAKISFETKVIIVNSSHIIHVPKAESVKLPSRGMVMVTGTINGKPFQAPLEPDGLKSHWFRVDLKEGTIAKVEMEAIEEWSEPEIPKDIYEALQKNSQMLDTWESITPKARWDWIRWIQATKNPDTRAKRITVMASKMRAGSRRPCCFNRNMCTDMDVCPRGVLAPFD